jgi:AraC-like DNA-binding protein
MGQTRQPQQIPMDSGPSSNKPTAQGSNRLAHAVAAVAASDGDYATAIPALLLYRRKAPTEPLHCIYHLGLAVVAQGGKQVLLDEQVINYGPGQSLLTTVDLPVISHVTRASVHEPVLALVLNLDARDIAQVAAEMRLPPPRRPSGPSIAVESLDAPLMEALVRLVNLLAEPTLVPHLAPLIQREITVRLLAGPHGPRLQHLALNGSPSQQIAKAVAWLKQNFKQPLNVDDFAARAHMSPSTFRQHFRSITGTSPLQYQKQLRLHEARQMMVSQNIDAGRAGGFVGYESPSQFSREYSRLFGAPPREDVRRMRLS